MDHAYEDKLDGRLDEQMWTRKMRDWRDQEKELEAALHRLQMPIAGGSVLTAQRTLELAHRAHSLYLTRNHSERGRLLKSVLLNCRTDGVNLAPTYRKPFDLIFERAKNEEWSGRVDLNHRPPGPEPGALTRLRYAPTLQVEPLVYDGGCGIRNHLTFAPLPTGRYIPPSASCAFRVVNNRQNRQTVPAVRRFCGSVDVQTLLA
jgi:hypothetical protein